MTGIGSTIESRGSIERRIVVLLLICVVLSAGALAALLGQMRGEAVTSAEKLLKSVVQLIEEQTARTLQNSEQSLEAAAALVATLATKPGDGKTATSIDGELRELLENRPYLVAVRVLDTNGHVLHSSDAGTAGLDLSGQPDFSQDRGEARSGFAFGVPVRNRVGGKWIIPVTQTWRAANGEAGGLIMAAIDPLFFDRVWTIADGIPDLAITLFRTDGLLLARSPFDERFVGGSYTSGIVFAHLRAGSLGGNFQGTSVVDGETRLFVYRKLAAYPGLVLFVGQTMHHVLEGWLATLWSVLAGWVAAVAAVGPLTLWLMHEWKKRRATQDRYRQLFDANPLAMFVVELASRRFLAANEAAVALYGWTKPQFLAMSANELYLPQDIPKVTTLLGETAPGIERTIHGLRHRTRAGPYIDVEIAARPIDLGGTAAVLSMIQDVTKRLALDEQFRQSQKMEAVGQLTGGIAHDFNNILTIILANADSLQEVEGLAPDVTRRLDQIAKAVQRATSLTHQLLAFSRKQPLRPRRTDINKLVAATGALLHRSLGEQVEIESVLAAGLWTVNVDRAQLETALVNLCVNARDAMAGGGKLRIETRNVTLDADYMYDPTIAPGDYAMLAVTDTGGGMAPDILARIFEPFFTTKDVGKGTGLGLSMVYGFIKQSGGHIRAESNPGQGTTFRLYLPRNDSGGEEAPPAKVETVIGGKERILVVEDDAQVRENVVLQLRGLGYAVAHAPDGGAGIAAFEAAAQPFDLLLTDVAMPGAINGKALADIVARRWPRTRTVFMSGYTENVFVQNGKLDAGIELLTKPFRRRELAGMVRRVLDAGRS